MRHLKQKQGASTCGAVAYAAILGLTELQGIRECKTKMRGRGAGTHQSDVVLALKARGIESHSVSMPQVKLKDVFWISYLSNHFPLYTVIEDRKRGSTHAIAIAEGKVYDGHFDQEIPIEAYKDVWVTNVLVVAQELPSYGKNS